MAATADQASVQPDAGRPQVTTGKQPEIRLYQHSPIMYWWAVWLYGFFCAALTYVQGERLSIGGGKPLLVYSGAWLGVSFTALLLFVIVATSIKTRGPNAFLLLVLGGLAATATYFILNWPGLFASPPSLLVHMNLAFYILVSVVLFVIWVVMVFIVDRLTYWRFRGTHIERVRRFAGILGRAPESYSILHVRLTRYSDDLLVHKILGLGIVGLGSSDVEARIAIVGGGAEQFRIEHVWRAAAPLREIATLMGPKATVVV